MKFIKNRSCDLDSEAGQPRHRHCRRRTHSSRFGIGRSAECGGKILGTNNKINNAQAAINAIWRASDLKKNRTLCGKLPENNNMLNLHTLRPKSRIAEKENNRGDAETPAGAALTPPEA